MQKMPQQQGEPQAYYYCKPIPIVQQPPAGHYTEVNGKPIPIIKSIPIIQQKAGQQSAK